MRLITTVIFFSIGILSLAQNAVLKGVIKEKTHNTPLEFALVFNQNYISTQTDSTGFFELSIPEGVHKITFSKFGYQAESMTLDLKTGEVREVAILLETQIVSIDQVVVSAGKFEQKLSELTVSMDVIKTSLIENKNTTSVENILQSNSGVAIVDGEPQIRGGSGYSFGAGSRVAIMVDDMSVLSGDAGRPSWGFLPVENIEQIEVIKGASSVLYGSSALSGVINIRTSLPETKPKTKVTLFHGLYSNPTSDNAKYWEGQPMQSGMNFFHSRKLGNLGIVFGANFLGDDGHLGPMFEEGGDSLTPPYNPFNVNRFEAEYRIRGNVSLKYNVPGIKGLNLGLNTSWLKGESMAGLLWENNREGLYSIYQGSATRTKQIIGTVDPVISYLGDKGAKHVIRGRWQKLDNNNDNDQDNYSDVYLGEYQFHQAMDSIGLQGLKTTAGVVGSFTESEAQLYSGGSNNGINTAQNIAAYLQLDQILFERLNISAGVRYEYFKINSESESRPVFRSGLNYRVAEETYLRASYGQGYRFPTIAEKFINTSVGVISIFPNENITSENSSNTEIGVKQGVKIGKLKGFADVALFYQRYDRFIEFTFGQWFYDPTMGLDGLGWGFKSVNTDKAEVLGAELTFNGSVELGKSTIQFLTGYTYTLPRTLTPDYEFAQTEADTSLTGVNESLIVFTYNATSENPDNGILKYRIQHMFRADIQWSTKKIDLGFSARTNSQMENIDKIYGVLDESGLLPSGINEWRENHKKPDAIFDARFSYHFNQKHKLSFIVSNLTNLEYSMRPLNIEPPRTSVLQYIYSL